MTRRRRAWFWVGVVLLSISALFWLILIIAIALHPENAGALILAGVIFTAIPIGIGIYGIRRGRTASSAEGVEISLERAGPDEATPRTGQQKRQLIGLIKDDEFELVIRMPRSFRVGGFIVLLIGAPLLIGGLLSIGEDGFWMSLGGLLLLLIGIWALGRTTRLTFNQSAGYITIIRRDWPLFLWFLRKRRISSDEARTAFIHSVERYGEYYRGGKRTAYQVKVVMRSGKELTLHEDWSKDVAYHLKQRITEFG